MANEIPCLADATSTDDELNALADQYEQQLAAQRAEQLAAAVGSIVARLAAATDKPRPTDSRPAASSDTRAAIEDREADLVAGDLVDREKVALCDLDAVVDDFGPDYPYHDASSLTLGQFLKCWARLERLIDHFGSGRAHTLEFPDGQPRAVPMSDSEAFERITGCEARIDRLVSLPFVQTLRALFEAEGRDFNEPDLRRVRAELSLKCESMRMSGMQVNDLDALGLQDFIPELAEYWGRPNPIRLDHELPSKLAIHVAGFGDSDRDICGAATIGEKQAAAIDSEKGHAANISGRAALPKWDNNNWTLTVGQRTTQFKKRAKNIDRLLTAFESQGWREKVVPDQLAGEISSCEEWMRYAIRDFNKKNSGIEFSSELGGARWRHSVLCAE